MSQNVAIIGAGLAGLGLALALHEQGIKATVYENRPAPLNIGGAVMLSPNALRIFDALGFYQDVRDKGYNFEQLHFQATSGEVLDIYEFGGEQKYGYSANRIYRYELIDIILAKIKAKGIEVNFGRKFSHVEEETDEGVTWQFTDGTTATAALLVGADGIHSTVRKYLAPDLVPKFIGMVGITAAVPRSQLPSSVGSIDSPLTILSKTKGAFVIAPQKVDGSEFLIGKQKRVADQTREGWDKIHADKDAAVRFLQEDNEEFGEIAVSATKHIPHGNINIWPFYMVQKLEHWASQKRRVLLVGDAAHAIPPSAGQGISQAFEDVYMLALLFAEASHGTVSTELALAFWQSYRQDRVEKVLVLNRQVDERRLPKSESSQEQKDQRMEWDLEWLYKADLKTTVEDWVRNRNQLNN